MPDEPNDPNRPEDANWLQGQLTRASTQPRDTIAAQIGEDAHNVVVGKNIIQIGSLQIPRYLVVIIACGVLALVVIGVWNGQKSRESAENSKAALAKLEATPTPTSTPPPQPMGADSFNIVVAQFGRQEGGDVPVDHPGSIISEWLALQLDNLANQLEPTNMGKIMVWHDRVHRPPSNPSIGVVRSEAEAAAVKDRVPGVDLVIYGLLEGPETAPQLALYFYYQSTTIQGEPDAASGRHQFGISIPVRFANDSTLLKQTLAKNGDALLSLRARALIWLAQGLAQEILGDPEAALHIFQAAEADLVNWEDQKGRSVFTYFAGHEALTLQQLDLAQQKFEAALMLNPDYPNAQIGLGKVYYQRAQLYLVAGNLEASNATLVNACPALAAPLATNSVLLPVSDEQALADVQLATQAFTAAKTKAEAIVAQMPADKQSSSFWPSVLQVAQLMLSNAQRLTGEIYVRNGELAAAETELQAAVASFQTTLNDVAGDTRYGFSQYVYLGLGATYRAQGYIYSAPEEKAAAKASLQQAQTNYTQCMAADTPVSSPDQQADLETVHCLCGFYKQQVEEEIKNLEEGGEG